MFLNNPFYKKVKNIYDFGYNINNFIKNIA